MNSVVERVRANAELGSVFARLWDPKRADYRKLFFAHSDLLFFPVEEGSLRTLVPLLYAGSGSDVGERVLEAVADAREGQRDALVRAADASPVDVWSDVSVAVCLHLVRFMVRNPGVAQLTAAGEPSWASVATAIAEAPPAWDVFDEVRNLIRNGPEVGDDVLRAKLKRHGRSAVGFMTKGDFFKLAGAIDVSSMMLGVYGEFRKHLEKLIAARRLSGEAYAEILNDLYVRRLVANVSTTFWCARCHDDVACLTSQSRLGPSQLALPCPKCGQQMFCGTLYDPDPTLRDACLASDGLLGVAVGWLLAKHKIGFAAGRYARDQELDFRFALLGREILVECKMHKTHKDAETVMRHLQNDLSQAIRHAEEVRSTGKLDQVWIVTK